MKHFGILSVLMLVLSPAVAHAVGAVATLAGGFTVPCDGANHVLASSNTTGSTIYVRGFQLSTFFPSVFGNNYVYLVDKSTGHFLWFSFVNGASQTQTAILPSASYVQLAAGEEVDVTVYCTGGGAGEGVLVTYYDISTP